MGVKIERQRCAKRLYGFVFNQHCSRYAIEGSEFCKQHDPELTQARRKAKAAVEKAAWKVKQEARDRVNAIKKAESAVIEAAKGWLNYDVNQCELREAAKALVVLESK